MLQFEYLYFASFWWGVEDNVVGDPGVEPGFGGAFVGGEMFFVVGYEELLDGGMATCDS